MKATINSSFDSLIQIMRAQTITTQTHFSLFFVDLDK